jgi:hypothetical protein
MISYRQVRVGKEYAYNPAPLDSIDPPFGVTQGNLKTGDTVRVVNLPGCPKAGTMGHCHIENPSGNFLGLVCVDSLDNIS